MDENAEAGGGTTANDTSEKRRVPETVPYSEFSAARKERADALKRVADLEAQVAQVAELQKTVETYKAKEAEWGTERTLMESGFLDPEARDVAKYLYSRLPEKDRPALPDMVKTWTADPSKAPRPLQPYLAASKTQDEGKPEAGGEQQKPEPAGLPPQNKGARSTAPATSPLSAEQIKNMSLDEYKKHRESIRSEYGKRR
jgi:hypothetical protein